MVIIWYRGRARGFYPPITPVFGPFRTRVRARAHTHIPLEIT